MKRSRRQVAEIDAYYYEISGYLSGFRYVGGRKKTAIERPDA